MSFFDTNLDTSNKPNGKSSQTFYFKTHYEAKHAIGKKHKKRLEFQSRDGISNIQSLCDHFIHSRENPQHYGRFIISGNPSSVDKLMIEIANWLETCQNIHYRNMDY